MSTTWIVLSNQRLAEFQSLPPPWIICKALWLSSSSSSSLREGARSMQMIMQDVSIDCKERALIKSIDIKWEKRKEGRGRWFGQTNKRGRHPRGGGGGGRASQPWSNWWRHWAQSRLLAVVSRPSRGGCWVVAFGSASSAVLFCPSDSIMASRLSAISSVGKRRPLWRTSSRQNYTNRHMHATHVSPHKRKKKEKRKINMKSIESRGRKEGDQSE